MRKIKTRNLKSRTLKTRNLNSRKAGNLPTNKLKTSKTRQKTQYYSKSVTRDYVLHRQFACHLEFQVSKKSLDQSLKNVWSWWFPKLEASGIKIIAKKQPKSAEKSTYFFFHFFSRLFSVNTLRFFAISGRKPFRIRLCVKWLFLRF